MLNKKIAALIVVFGLVNPLIANATSVPDFNFLDCKGNTFNTAVAISQRNVSKCQVEGIISTKYEVNGVKKAISEMSAAERKKIFLFNTNDDRAIFALAVAEATLTKNKNTNEANLR